MKDPKDIISFRLRPETIGRLKMTAGHDGITVSALVSDILDAYTERRVIIVGNCMPYNDGQNPHDPVLIDKGTRCN